MRRGGVVRIRLLPREAPTNAFRLWEMAGRGELDGLTFHRVVPNFVLQGGSPGANEFMGDRLFMRDELGLSNLRGTVGVSTRGRDTGDAQFFVNLVDNVRLDMDYTVFAAVVDGMDVVDGIVEGDVIERIEIDQGSGIGDQGSGVAARWPRALTGLLRRGSCILMPDC
jgi:peptidyl-prolyl cis-trans isomerase B (cyclophilin B)